MRFIFLHHEVQGPIGLEELWSGTSFFAGSVGRLRILFWLADRGHELYLIGNVRRGYVRGVTGVAGFDGLRALCGQTPEENLLVLNNAPEEDLWRLLESLPVPKMLWAGNPLHIRWLARARQGTLARIVCVSQYHRDLYRIYGGFEAVEVVPSGVDIDLIEAVTPWREAEGSVLFCAAPRRSKGIHNLLRAWPHVRKEVPGVRLRITGTHRMHDPRLGIGRTGVLDPDVEEEFPEFFATPPKSLIDSGIELLGGVSLARVFGEMKAAAVAVVNCNWRGSFETYCRSAIEAQVAGTPVVGAARGALTEVVAHGRTGWLIDREDPRALADTIVRLLRDPQLCHRARKEEPQWARPLADYASLARNWEEVAQRARRREPAPAPRHWKKDLLRWIGYGSLRSYMRELIRGTPVERAILRRRSS